MKRVYVVLALSAAAVLGGLVWFQIHANRTNSANAKKIEQLCLGAKLAMEDDARDFESGDTRRQEAAYARFYSSHELYHGVDSLLYCVDALPEIPANCQYKKDWACLAKVARQIRASIP